MLLYFRKESRNINSLKTMLVASSYINLIVIKKGCSCFLELKHEVFCASHYIDFYRHDNPLNSCSKTTIT